MNFKIIFFIFIGFLCICGFISNVNAKGVHDNGVESRLSHPNHLSIQTKTENVPSSISNENSDSYVYHPDSLLLKLFTKNPVSVIANHFVSLIWDRFEEIVLDMKMFLKEKKNPYSSSMFSDWQVRYHHPIDHNGQDSAKSYTVRKVHVDGIESRFAPIQLILNEEYIDQASTDAVMDIANEDSTDVSTSHSTTTSIHEIPTENIKDGISSTPNNLFTSPSDSINSNPCSHLVQASNLYYSRWVQYDKLNYYCNSTKVTKEEYDHEKSWNPTCHEKIEPEEACFCAQDRRSERCNNVVPIACSISITSPEKDCRYPKNLKENEYSAGGVPILSPGESCWRFATEDSVTFTFLVNCSSNLTPETVDAARLPKNAVYTDLTTMQNMTWSEIMSGFSYYATSGSQNQGVYDFAISRRIPGPIFARPWNMNDFSIDEQVTSLTPSNPGHFTGDLQFSFNINMKELSRKYFTGNRLYLEIRFNHAHVSRSVHPFFIDFTDLSEPTRTNYLGIILGVTIPVASICLMAIISVFALCYFIKWRRDQKFLKND